MQTIRKLITKVYHVLFSEHTRLRNENAQLKSNLSTLDSQIATLNTGISALNTELTELKLKELDPPTPIPSNENMFLSMEGWSTQYTIDGKVMGGPVQLLTDKRMKWHIDVVGGVEGKRILELGPLEGAHTITLINHGAKEVIAIEGLRRAWLRCLVVKEILQVQKARFLYGDFCHYVKNYSGQPFDCVLAAGVLYHQTNPAELIHDLAKVTDTVLVWSQVANETHPSQTLTTVNVGSKQYKGKINDYSGARATSAGYCGGVHPIAVWLFPDDMRQAFIDAGFVNIVEEPIANTIHGQSLLFVASKKQNLKKIPLS